MDRNSDVVTLPFQGDRRYVSGVQLVEAALARQPRDPGTPVAIGCYDMIRTNAVRIEHSDTPLSPKEHDAIVQVVRGGAPRFIGLRGAGAVTGEVPVQTTECFEAVLDASVDVTGRGAVEVVNPGHPAGTLLAMLVLGIKRASQAGFAERGGKWVFAAARFPDSPGTWTRARAETAAQAAARVFQWTVTVDDTMTGTVTFYNFDTEA